MTKQPKWLQDFNKFLTQLSIDYDKRQKIIKTFLNILKELKKKWEKKHKTEAQNKLL